MNVSPGAYVIVTGSGNTPEQASADLFPENASVVLIEMKPCGPQTRFTFLVDYPDEAA